jgi:hypothetical protein
MVYIFDYIPVLEKFEWPLSLHRLAQKDEHRGNNKFHGYMIYYKYVIIIWSRIIDDLKTYQSLRNSTYEVIFPRSRTGRHVLTAHEKDLMAKTDTANAVLEENDYFIRMLCRTFTAQSKV